MYHSHGRRTDDSYCRDRHHARYGNGEEVTFDVARQHRPDLPKPINVPLHYWLDATFEGTLEPGETIEIATEMGYIPADRIIELRLRT